MSIDEIRQDNGRLSKYVWPGGFPLFYISEDNCILCPDCANDGEDMGIDDAIVAYDANWEDPFLYCEDCGEQIESAYAEDEED